MLVSHKQNGNLLAHDPSIRCSLWLVELLYHLLKLLKNILSVQKETQDRVQLKALKCKTVGTLISYTTASSGIFCSSVRSTYKAL